MTVTGELTIGVSLEIPEPLGSKLQHMRRSFGDPRADDIPTHVTLVPPTPVPAASWDVVRERLRAVADDYSPFIMQLRGTGTFRPVSPVVFVAIARGISDCQILSERLRTGELQQQLNFPYHPHVTVAHELDDDQLDIASDALADFEFTFMAHGFGAYIHGEDGRWRLEDRFSFGP
ncbi:2'-5' RNA ligase family protein [Saxibacter everestensis]|uniref:2'-5' RNA ligase family protein n=1 Tax=Saxibacter everestensis TaxID=2909229 RepID=A0ABY8QQZ4_9MICO|nr:2'-5' RNA ligase family protein [Brevibacteriaceae bacterium ZFBP1038]